MVDNNGAYTSYSYNTNGTEVTTATTITHEGSGSPGSGDEVATLTVTDGGGETSLKTRTENPNSTGGYTGKKFTYDILGRATAETTATEINSSWNPAGDDSAWHWNSRVFDWKGRVTQSIPSDSSGSDGRDTLISYDWMRLCGRSGNDY